MITIPSVHGSTVAKIEKSNSKPGGLFIRMGPEHAHISRNDLASELGVLTIDKADLPIVTDRGVHGNLFVADVPWAANLTVEALRQEAYDRLALAEYLEAHPPVDEQQVEALVTLLNETSDGHAQSAPNIARRLIATGKVTVQS